MEEAKGLKGPAARSAALPPYPTHPVVIPQPVPEQIGFASPCFPPEEPGAYKTQDPNVAVSSNAGFPTVEQPLVVSSFEDKALRKAFIRKVFSVVTLQLLVTFSVVCVFTFSDKVKAAVQGNIWIYLSSYIIFAVVGTALAAFSSFSRKHPWNLLGLALVTLSLSYMVGTMASYHNTSAVIIALGSTVIISFTIILFSAQVVSGSRPAVHNLMTRFVQTRIDFTICNGVLLVLSVDLLMFGFFSIFYYSSVLQIFYGCLGALLYAVFLAVDCQLVMGRQKYSLNPEEYVYGALIIYLDVIMIFLYILMLLGGSSKN